MVVVRTPKKRTRTVPAPTQSWLVTARIDKPAPMSRNTAAANQGSLALAAEIATAIARASRPIAGRIAMGLNRNSDADPAAVLGWWVIGSFACQAGTCSWLFPRTHRRQPTARRHGSPTPSQG